MLPKIAIIDYIGGCEYNEAPWPTYIHFQRVDYMQKYINVCVLIISHNTVPHHN